MACALLAPTLHAADAPLTEAEILDQADARIQKYRTAEVTLRIIADGQPLPAGTKVTIQQTRHAFLFGSNIFALGRCGSDERNRAYAEQFAELFNFATLPFYWWDYEREKGHPDFARVQTLVDWCQAHGVTCKGHPLAWNFVDPKWVPREPDATTQAQLGRITRDMQHFAGQIDTWDVVNEATQYDRSECKKNSPALTAAIAKQGVPTYLRNAFQTARKANPKATLLINDYITDASYADKVIRQLVDDDGRPLYDVIGIQCHQHGKAWSAKQTWEICERFAKFGKPLHFTEATIISGKPGWGLGDKGERWESTPEGEKRQAEEVTRFYTVLFSHPAVAAITWWDFSDNGAWQGAPAGFLRKDLTPKPAYAALKGLIKGRWWTRVETETQADGAAKLHGFLGDYEVRIASAAGTQIGRFTLRKDAGEPIEVRLTAAPKQGAAHD